MNLSDFMPQQDVVLGVAERVSHRFPEPSGACEYMTADLVKELTARKLPAKHVVGMFRLDEPDAEKYAIFDDTEGRDEYEVEHDWVEIEGRILDISAKQFRKSVHEKIPDIVFIGQSDPLAGRYHLINYHG